MAEQVEEIAKLLEELKRENELNNEDYTKILTDINNKLDSFSDNKEELDIVVNNIKQALDTKVLFDANRINSVNETLEELKKVVYTVSDYSELQEQVKVLAENFKSGFNSVVSFANKDTDAKNLLLDRMDSLEKSVRNGEVLNSLKQRTDELVKGYENFISDSNLRHGNMVSALVDLKNKIDDYSSKNNYMFGTMNHTMEETHDKITGLETTISSNLGNVTSKLYSIGDEVQKILNDGFDNLKYLSSNVSEAMNSSSLDVKTTLEALRANISDYSNYLKEEFQNFNQDITEKLKNGEDSRIILGNDIISKIRGIELLYTEKSTAYENFVNSKIANVTEIIDSMKEVYIGAKTDNEVLLDNKFTDLNKKLNEINSEFEKLLVNTSKEIRAVTANLAQTSDEIILKLTEANNGEFSKIKNELLTSSSANLNSILEKIQILSDSTDKFQNAVADNFSNYITELKESLETFGNKTENLQNNEEIIDKLTKLEFIVSKISVEKDANFEKLKELIENNSSEVNTIAERSRSNFENLKELITSNSLSKDEKLDAIKELLENNTLLLENLKSSDNSNENYALIKELINEKSSSKDEKLEKLQELIENNASILTSLKLNTDSDFGIEHIEEVIRQNSAAKDEKLDNIKSLIENNPDNAKLIKSIDEVSKIINDYESANSDKLDEVKNYTEKNYIALEAIKNFIDNQESLDKLEEIIIKHKASGDEKLDLIKALIDNNSGILESLKLNQESDTIVEQLGEIISKHSHSKDEKLEEIKELLENSITVTDTNNDSIKSEIIETRNRIEEIITQNSSSKDEKLEDLKTLVESYKNSIEKLYNNISANTIEKIKELSEAKDTEEISVNTSSVLENLSSLINSQTVDFQETLSKEVKDIKLSIQTINDTVSASIASSNDESTNLHLSELSNQLGEISQNYEHSLSILSSRLTEYIDASEKLSVTTGSKLADSVTEFEKIQARFDELSGRLTTLIGNSGLIEILANIRQQFNVVIEELKKEREGAISDVKTSLEEVVSLINNNLYLVGQNIEAVYAKQIDNSANLISGLDNGLTSIKNDFNETIKTVEETLSEKIKTLSEDFEPVKTAITEFTEFDYATAFSNLKEKVELSYVNFASELKDLLDSNTGAIDKVEETYETAVEKLSQLEEIVKDSVNTNLENINNTLVSVHNVAESNLDIAEDMQISFQADLLKLESNLQEERSVITASITEGLQSIRNLIEKQKGMDAEELRTAILPLLENEELVDVIRGLNKSLADKITEFQQDTNLAAQDIVDIANSINNTADYVLDLIQDKFENAGKNAEKILEKIEELNKKLDNSELGSADNGEVLDAISDLNYILNGISDNISSVGNILSSGNEFKSILEKLDEITSGQNVSGHDTDIMEIKNILEKSGKNFNILLKYEETLISINNKLDVLVMSQEDDYTEIIEDEFNEIKSALNNSQTSIISEIGKIAELKKDINDVLDNFKTYEKSIGDTADAIIAKLDTISKTEFGTLNNKLDIIAQTDNEELLEELENLHTEIEEIKSILNKADSSKDYSKDIESVKEQLTNVDTNIKDYSKKVDSIKDQLTEVDASIEDYSKNIDCKLDEISQFTSVNEKLDTIKTDLQSGKNLEPLIHELNNKVDIIAMAEDDDILDELYEIKSTVEEMLISSEKNSKIEDLLNKLKGEITELTDNNDLKNYVTERTNELHHMLTDVKHQLSSLTSTPDEMDAYTYTMQDVESDIAKLRLVINDLANKSEVNELAVISTNVNKLARSLNDLRQAILDAEMRRTVNGDINEEIASISSRLNKFLLSKREFESEIFAKLEKNTNAISVLDNKFSPKRIEKKLNDIDSKLDYTANVITILKNVMMYLGEWMDGTTETLSSIYDRCYLPDVIEELKNVIPDSKNLTEYIKNEYIQQEENIENLQNIIENTTSQSEVRAEELQNLIESRLLNQEAKISKLENLIENKIEQQETRLDRIEKQLDKISRIVEFADSNSAAINKIDELDEKLTHLSASIEKLAVYVE